MYFRIQSNSSFKDDVFATAFNGGPGNGRRAKVGTVDGERPRGLCDVAVVEDGGLLFRRKTDTEMIAQEKADLLEAGRVVKAEAAASVAANTGGVVGGGGVRGGAAGYTSSTAVCPNDATGINPFAEFLSFAQAVYEQHHGQCPCRKMSVKRTLVSSATGGTSDGSLGSGDTNAAAGSHEALAAAAAVTAAKTKAKAVAQAKAKAAAVVPVPPPPPPPTFAQNVTRWQQPKWKQAGQCPVVEYVSLLRSPFPLAAGVGFNRDLSQLKFSLSRRKVTPANRTSAQWFEAAPNGTGWAVSLEFYVGGACPPKERCALMHRVRGTSLYTPELFYDHKNTLNIQLSFLGGFGRLVRVEKLLKPEQWCFAVVSITSNGMGMRGCFGCGADGRADPKCVSHAFPTAPVIFEPLDQLWFVGASHAWKATRGFVANLRYYDTDLISLVGNDGAVASAFGGAAGKSDKFGITDFCKVYHRDRKRRLLNAASRRLKQQHAQQQRHPWYANVCLNRHPLLQNQITGEEYVKHRIQHPTCLKPGVPSRLQKAAKKAVCTAPPKRSYMELERSCTTLTVSVDFQGSDILGGQQYAQNAAACLKMCIVSKKCTHWTYYNGVCYSKTSGKGKKLKAGAVSGSCSSPPSVVRVTAVSPRPVADKEWAVRRNRALKLHRKSMALLEGDGTTFWPDGWQSQLEADLLGAGCDGVPEAHFLLAVVKAAGLVSEPDEDFAVQLLKMAASHGAELAQLALAFRYRHGIGLEKDTEASLGLYLAGSQRALRDQGAADGDAHHHTKHIRIDDFKLMEGYGDEGSDEVEYIRMQADIGVATAQVDMGQVYYWGHNGVDRDFAEAARWFERAAGQGDAHAQFTLGVMNRHGQGIPGNITAMREYFERAADQNHTSALNGLGVYHLEYGGNTTKVSDDFPQPLRLSLTREH